MGCEVVMRRATCQCGQLVAECRGDPVRTSVCHCLECQRRSGSSFAAQARFRAQDVATSGSNHQWSRTGDEGGTATFHFCPQCGSGVYYTADTEPGLIAVATGAFAEPRFPPPDYSVYEDRKHSWVAILGDEIERYD